MNSPEDGVARQGKRVLKWLALTAVVGVGIWWLASTFFVIMLGFDDAPGEWAAIVYPDRNDRTRFYVTPRFKTFENCRESAIERMKSIEIETGGDYECGYKCELDGDPRRMNVCEKVQK